MIAILFFLVTLIIGIPMAFVLGMTGIAHLSILENASQYKIIIQRMFAGVNSTDLLCIPFFVMAGELMNKSGITLKIVDFIRELVGTLRGGLAYVTVLVGMVLSSILGSSNAVAAILSSVLVPQMIKDKYDQEFAAAVAASSGLLGPIIPPSILFIIYGVLTGASVKKLLMGGIIPGILIGCSYIVTIYIITKKKNYPKAINKINYRNLLKAFMSALPTFIIPFIIMGGVLFGIFTPTESGTVAVASAFILGLLYRTLKLSDILDALYNTLIVTSSIMIVIAMGNIMGWTFAMDQIPLKLANIINKITSNPNMIMLLVLIMQIGIGCVMEGFAALIIFAPVFTFLLTSVGFDLIHIGLIFCIMINIGLITPPVGMVLFVTSNITNTPLSKLNISIMPFFIAAFIITFILAFLPQITLLIPNLF